MMGRILEMPVKEGDQVAEGDLLVRLESIQTEADVRAAEATLEAAQAEIEGMGAQIRSTEASINTAKAEIARSEADLARAQQNYDRAQDLIKEGLISREQSERIKTELDISRTGLAAAKARLAQTEAQAAQVLKQKEGLSLRLAQQRSSLIRARDQFSKTTINAPLEGIITSLPVNVGEIAIVGVQNQAGTVLMTIADMSVITAEVKVDETDIVNVKVGQKTQIRVDALGDRLLDGTVTEVGNSALTRTGGISSTSSTSNEAKDFKVVVTLDNPPPELRPGLSCTATIVTATRENTLTVPIQALTIREFDPPADGGEDNGAATATKVVGSDAKKKIEKEGVFVVKNGVATFRAVKTGIIGTTDLELLDGLTEGEEIVTGTYQVLRTLQDNATVKPEEIKKP
jgi:HlyD family secretion protein